jgi:hypothetical protein
MLGTLITFLSISQFHFTYFTYFVGYIFINRLTNLRLIDAIASMRLYQSHTFARSAVKLDNRAERTRRLTSGESAGAPSAREIETIAL